MGSKRLKLDIRAVNEDMAEQDRRFITLSWLRTETGSCKGGEPPYCPTTFLLVYLRPRLFLGFSRNRDFMVSAHGLGVRFFLMVTAQHTIDLNRGHGLGMISYEAVASIFCLPPKCDILMMSRNSP